MKNRIDAENPFIKLAAAYHLLHSIQALNATQSVEKSVIPIYAIPKAKGHQKPKKKAEQYGSGILLEIKGSFFILSCTHLFETFNEYVLQTSAGNGTLVEYLVGERFSSGNISTPFSNRLDATVFHVQSDLSNDLKDLAICLDDLEFEDDGELERPIYLCSGFRIKKSNTSGNTVNSKREAYPTLEITSGDYELFGVNRDHQLITAWDDNVLVDGRWQQSPIPRGFSGGAVIKIQGTNLTKSAINDEIKVQKLKAIIIEQHRAQNNIPGILLSTRINVHIGLIYQFLPELFADNEISQK